MSKITYGNRMRRFALYAYHKENKNLIRLRSRLVVGGWDEIPEYFKNEPGDIAVLEEYPATSVNQRARRVEGVWEYLGFPEHIGQNERTNNIEKENSMAAYKFCECCKYMGGFCIDKPVCLHPEAPPTSMVRRENTEPLCDDMRRVGNTFCGRAGEKFERKPD